MGSRQLITLRGIILNFFLPRHERIDDPLVVLQTF
jgi:hypothetical protein